jgi:hypothetical protein
MAVRSKDARPTPICPTCASGSWTAPRKSERPLSRSSWSPYNVLRINAWGQLMNDVTRMAELETTPVARPWRFLASAALVFCSCSQSVDARDELDASLAPSHTAGSSSSAESSPSLDAGMDAGGADLSTASDTSHDTETLTVSTTDSAQTSAAQTSDHSWWDAGTPDASSSDAGDDEDALFIPRGIPNEESSGADYGLTLSASTLVREPSGLRFYAAVRNVGGDPVCRATMLVNFYDSSDQQIAVASADLLTSHLYHSADDTLIIACVAPGELAVAALDVNYDIRVEDIARMEHLFPAFGFEVVPYPPFTVEDVQFAAHGERGTYSGTFRNGLEATVEQPRVTIVQLTAVGRPTHVASRTEDVQIAPGGEWPFDVEVPGPSADFVTFAMANVPLE